MFKRIFDGVLAILLCSLFPVPAPAADKPVDDVQAVVTMLDGSAQVLMKGERAAHSIRKGDRLSKDQKVQVADRSRIEMRFPDGTVMRFSERSTVKLNDVYYNRRSGDKSVKVDLVLGKLWANVKKLVTSGSRVEVKTTNAVAGVRGTVYRVNVEEDKSAVVKVYDGSVSVSGIPREAQEQAQGPGPVPVPGPHPVPPPYHEVTMEEWHVIVKSFQEVTISPEGKPSEPKDFTPQEDADDWVKWNRERDRDIQF
jgi:hypothetical protein